MSQNRTPHPSANQTVSQTGLFKNPLPAISDQDLILNDLKSKCCLFEFQNANQESDFIQSLYFKLESDSGLFYFSQDQAKEKCLTLTLVWNYQGKNNQKAIDFPIIQLLDESFLDKLDMKTPPIPFLSCENIATAQKKKSKCSIV